MALAFAAVVTNFVAWLTGLLPDSTSDIFSNEANSFGAFLNAAVVVPAAGRRRLLLRRDALHQGQGEVLPGRGAGTPADVALLEEIRDLLKAQQGGATPTA